MLLGAYICICSYLAMTLYVERETYRDDIIIMEHLHQATQTHTKQHV